MKKRIFCFVLIFLFAFSVYCEEDTKGLLEYLADGKKAIESEYFDKAVEIFNEAERVYPSSYLPNSYKGDLYKKYDLYKSAINEYEKALKKQSKSITLYNDLAECYSNQGDEEKAIEIYKRALMNVYNSSDLYNSLAWSYIKTNRIDESLSTLKEALDNYPNSADLLVTLGSAYYSADDYENAKKAYLSSEYNSFKQSKSGVFRAIVKYNQASLEQSFGHYQDAMKTADSANTYTERSSAHILLAEIYYNMLDFQKSLSEVSKASRLQPITLYPDQLLARISILTNNTQKAQEIINRLENNHDHKWLSTFSTSLDDYFAHVYSLAAELYKTKSVLSYTEFDNPVTAFIYKWKYKIESFIYKIKYANICLRTGGKQINGGSVSSGLENLYEAYSQFDILSGKALKVLNILAERETETRPFTTAKYNILKSYLKQKSSFFYTKKQSVDEIIRNMASLDTKWQKVAICDAYIYLIESTFGQERQEYINKLFMLCPSVVAGYGMRLDCRIEFIGDMSPTYRKKILHRLKKYKIYNDDNSSLSLMIRLSDTDMTVVAQDLRGQSLTFAKDIDTSEKNIAKQIWRCIFVR